MFIPRYFVFCLPALCLAAALGVSRLKPAVLLAPALVVLLGLGFHGIVAYYRSDFDIPRDDWRTATEYLRTNASASDAVVFHVAMARMPYEYYKSLDRAASTYPEVVYPNHGDKITFLDFVEKPDYKHVAQELSQYSRVWVVVSHAIKGSNMDATASALAGLAAENRVLRREENFGVDLKILLYEPQTPTMTVESTPSSAGR